MLWAPPVVPPPELVPIPVMPVVALLLVSPAVVPLSKELPVPGVVSPVAMVTPEAPEKEVKKAQPITVTIAAPPRMPPKSALNRRIRRRGAPPSARK